MLTFYYSPAPNPRKVALLLEETGLTYEAVPVDTRRGEQHLPGFLALNPNAKVPVLVDDDGRRVFDSSAILLHLAEKTGRFQPEPALRGEMLSWLMFTASGLGPYTGQYVHFTRYAPQPLPYAIERYEFEAWRHWRIVEAQLAGRRWMLGDDYTIVDMAVWGWGRSALPVLGDERAAQELPRLKQLIETIDARPAAQRALALPGRHPFKTGMDAQAWQAMFPHYRGPLPGA
jgi:GSH-dependent disulfide-bond oxidoreductase